MELVYMYAWGAYAARLEGSSPFFGNYTNYLNQKNKMLNISKKIFLTFIAIFLWLGSFAIIAAETETSQTNTDTKCTIKWAKPNKRWKCACEPWYKQVDNECVSCATPWVCCGIQLHTNIPFIWNCIKFANSDSQWISQVEAFPQLMGNLMKILLTVIILWGFAGIMAGWVMIAAAGPDDQKAKKGRKLITNIAIAIAVLGASGVILRLINPNFFL